MIRSFDYISFAALFKQLELGILHQDRLPQLEPWAGFWHRWVSAVYLRAYLEKMRGGDVLPLAKNDVAILLNAHLLDKAVHEVAYELKHRPAWTRIPLQAIVVLLGRWSGRSD
jgi:maltose alpha-D-glucosyltransferase/alpha-amylase